MDWIAACLMLIANVILIKTKHWSTFVILFVANLMYSYWWFIHQQWPTLALTSIFTLQNVWGFYMWKIKDSKNP